MIGSLSFTRARGLGTSFDKSAFRVVVHKDFPEGAYIEVHDNNGIAVAWGTIRGSGTRLDFEARISNRKRAAALATADAYGRERWGARYGRE